MEKKQNRATFEWYSMDLHLHTPASSDYQQPEVSYLEILQKAETRGLNIISFTDHNTVAGYRRLCEEIDQLELLEKLNRLLPEEKNRLAEFRRLTKKILILPGFEFTATFGFHIQATFSPEKPTRDIEHLLLSLSIPADQLDEGQTNAGATVDVLTAYRLINQAGGLVIAAHANSSNGVAMKGLGFGGQTRIAYTQDTNLHALEVTDLEANGTRSTAAFFNGTKPEYPRRMHCIQGSDSHRLNIDPLRKKNLGIGDRATDVLLSDLNFDALKELFLSNDFSRTRPHRYKEEPAFDFIQAALDEGPNIVQDFHESMTVRAGKLYNILADVCAFANTNGGTLFIGLSTDPQKPPASLTVIDQSTAQLEKEISSRVSPPLTCTINPHDFKGKKIIRILVPRGDDPPYALDDYKIYVRDEEETNLAVRDEVVALVMRGAQKTGITPPVIAIPVSPEITPAIPENLLTSSSQNETDIAPRTGVEVMPPEERKGKTYYSLRDLRNGNVVKNVTRASARKLWQYAIQKYSEIRPGIEKMRIQWQGEFGLLFKYRQGKSLHYDFIQKTPQGYRFFFGVTSDGIHGPWKVFVGDDEQ